MRKITGSLVRECGVCEYFGFNSITFIDYNLLCLVYTPVGIYCDWRELRRTNNVKHVKILNQIRFVFFSSILYPSTMFSDCLFWKLWIKNRELVAPSAIDVLVPLWLQHCLHTFTLAATFLDLLLVPRRRPKNLTLGASILAVFLAVYGVVRKSVTRELRESFDVHHDSIGYRWMEAILAGNRSTTKEYVTF
ncbi:hypothetical protein MSG28_006413 [Choristoneura fumiferana]|uniref:Uncharacterized protein n=1 Tax=Choristoneura fumiferana TaxID=7141 RepID=A0ACC0JEQ5_CHOFU|nr:hypothetical protein MSG28_006413 [Choristoneura fumiferana]